MKRARRPHPQHGVEGPRFLEEPAFSEDFCRFLQTSVPTVDAAELLLALAAEPERRWRLDELAQLLRPATTLSDVELARYVEQFHAAGLLAIGQDGRIRYCAQHGRLAAHVESLSQAYKARPVTLFRVIYAARV